ncbi:hypothetical protein EG328_009406 [Venturia inaequalis]|uniref:F-box domain-containing protein n=1 Tax=Venturia inaequalis TaxID=5025 RepID=A0A8H3YQF1_VENIN|nr:hypothetical protein EG328_009406 [Venturia inaequalis]
MRKDLMRRDNISADEDEPLVDTTAALAKKSKRLDRKLKKLEKKRSNYVQPMCLLDFPYELIMNVFTQLQPSDLFNLRRTSKALNDFIISEETVLSKDIINRRYQALSRCFPIPRPIEDVEPEMRDILLGRQNSLNIHWRPYQHIKKFNPLVTCTCITCVLRWNNLNIIVDFAHFQSNLDQGQPIPMIQRGRNPEWNQKLIGRNAEVVENALHSRLWYARILEAHLKSTVGSISRHAANKGNKRRRFRMTSEDAESQTDVFLANSGPPTIDSPFHRDNYHMLEAFLPNRGWFAEEKCWKYMPESHHLRDLDWVKQEWKKREKERSATTLEQSEVDHIRKWLQIQHVDGYKPVMTSLL